MTIGSMAVDAFFVTSGFLVTSSLLRTKSIASFVRSRCLRIFPGLLVMLTLTVFGIGLLFTNSSVRVFLLDERVYAYLLKNATLVLGIKDRLPGVFESNPYRASINGSLWTMPYEIRMYVLLGVLWLVVNRWLQRSSITFAAAACCLAAASGSLLVASHLLGGGDAVFVRLFFMFFAGSALFACADKIVLRHDWFAVAVVLTALRCS